MCKRMELDPYLILYTTINSTLIENLNIKPQTKELLEENIENKLFDIECVNYYFGFVTKSKISKKKINK